MLHDKRAATAIGECCRELFCGDVATENPSNVPEEMNSPSLEPFTSPLNVFRFFAPNAQEPSIPGNGVSSQEEMANRAMIDIVLICRDSPG
jgi:hypothetical protein